ncbi:MAG: 2OG-Fe(II) oxygenase [Marinicaulis sp.]|nr:hypothetical protein [Marinicaulis sp.]NNE39458.1 2OG-Fe(II) oxygenase [Marinicaulis sp.]NNL90126.1 2OG-Fe(II) oxygenase [Marinicaulis sp.]
MASETSLSDPNRIVISLRSALSAATPFSMPYRHWMISDLFPGDIARELAALEFPVADPGEMSGKRELHNETRCYFDQKNICNIDCAAKVANALQSPEAITLLNEFFSIDLSSTYLRLEYAQDVSNFWLEPHTDLGVKKITILIYLNNEPAEHVWGTDIFNADKTHALRTPFKENTALAFVPGADTYHGFKQREFDGVRKSLILNYVTEEWRDRAQLAFPNDPVTAG